MYTKLKRLRKIYPALKPGDRVRTEFGPGELKYILHGKGETLGEIHLDGPSPYKLVKLIPYAMLVRDVLE